LLDSLSSNIQQTQQSAPDMKIGLFIRIVSSTQNLIAHILASDWGPHWTAPNTFRALTN